MQGDTTHWSSASSPEEGSSPLDVGTYMASGDRGAVCAATDTTISDANAKVTAKGRGEVLSCGFMCHGKHKSGRTCRKVINGHNRGAVCPDCMDESVYHQCANGCFAYVHVGCADSAPWTCDKCRAKPQEPEQVHQEQYSESESDAGSASEIEEATIETIDFENHADCHGHLRDNHFVIQKRRFKKGGQLTHVDYKCEGLLCTAKFTVRRKGDSEAWQAPLLVAHQVGSTSYLCLYNHH